MDDYQKRGYNSRKEYLDKLVEKYNVDEDLVFTLAATLGKEKDFNDLVTCLETAVKWRIENKDKR